MFWFDVSEEGPRLSELHEVYRNPGNECVHKEERKNTTDGSHLFDHVV